MKRLTALIVLFPIIAISEPQPWMKTGKPDLLGISVFVSRCPSTSDDIKKIVHEEMVKSKVNPVGILDTDPFLRVDIRCIKLKSSSSYVITSTYEFVTISLAPNTKGSKIMRIGGQAYRHYQRIGNTDYLESSVRQVMASITSDWIQANTNMDDDE